MAIDSNFSSLLQTLKPEDPWLPPRPWESISSESGLPRSHSQPPNTDSSLPDPSTISESSLVRLAINALQGVEASLHSIERLSELFSTDPADRTSHRIPGLWNRSSSTNALGKVLKSVGRSGFIALLSRKFVDYFHRGHLDVGCEEHECRSLVNQAFAVAVEKFLEGFVCALDTLYASVQLRRSPESFDVFVKSSPGVGCLTSVVNSEITFMEVYLHTKELRTQIEAIGNVCMFEKVALAFSKISLEDLTAEAIVGFHKFPRGADLLSYLYAQLRDADPVHRALFNFLFIRSCEPYHDFIKSWIYEARISDPYKEFIVEYVDGSTSYSHGGASFPVAVGLSSIRVRDGVSVPCFLENFCHPLLRAGQQLQVLIKLLELCNCARGGDQALEDILPCWSGSSSSCLSTMSPLTFSKTKIEEMVLMRENMYRTMQEKLQVLIGTLDNQYQPLSSNVMSFGIVHFVVNNSKDTANIPSSCSMDESRISPSIDKRDLDSEADDISYQVDPFDSSSECSSWNSSGEQIQTEENIEVHDSSIEAELRYLSASMNFKNLTNGHILLNPSQNKKQHALDSVCRTNDEGISPISKFANCHKGKKSTFWDHHKSANANWSRFPETVYADYQSINCWPLGGLVKNPFNYDAGLDYESKLHLIDSILEVCDRNEKFVEEEIPYLGELCTSENSLSQGARRNVRLKTRTQASFSSDIPTSWKFKYNCNLFNMNPMVTKDVWSYTIDNTRGRRCVDPEQSFLLSFDFSSVKDPRIVYGERLITSRGHEFQSKLHSDSDVSSVKTSNECFREQKYGETDTSDEKISLSGTLFENRQEEISLTSTSGGAKWESSLSYLGKRSIHGCGGHTKDSGSNCSIPLDIIIDKCILQEILLQYEYISTFTIKLLEEGFDLQEHLLALRRYHFVEFADWADLFIMSLWRHKWSVTEASDKLSEIQGLLDMAVQRSSCEVDPYKERLYLYMKSPVTTPLSTTTTGVHAFDFIALGYRVDWPVSIVLTSSALRIYAEIFSFLIQVKLAVFSLTDVWCTMKDLTHLISQNHQYKLNEQDRTHINNLMKMRHQVNHFVSTLQQYVQSQLSHVSWCRFLHSLKHKVKDMFDLESVHMAYLADSLHICFLSDETRPVAGIIESILQCALDFRSCFGGGCWEVGLNCGDTSKIFGRLNISQVLTIKATFEKSLKELYLCYLKSPKHGEFSLSSFWGYLNYNDYYSGIIDTGPMHYVF